MYRPKTALKRTVNCRMTPRLRGKAGRLRQVDEHLQDHRRKVSESVKLSEEQQFSAESSKQSTRLAKMFCRR
ncbi:hypothetical protein TYRP_003928 [Tyrophagus putrescentiae]|nr:hypothetical protein TYRP_003928 [Tyrophagus putrescentiae]